jgi:glutathione gamma-glutamylcysteinyltransferase
VHQFSSADFQVAYNPGLDVALLLDVARYKYPPFWVQIDALFGALATVDPAARSDRGVYVASRAQPPAPTVQPHADDPRVQSATTPPPKKK